jgi:L-rhamnose isomerase
MFQQKSFIANAVKVAPLQTGSELIRNVQDSPTKAIDHKYKGSVDRLVRKQQEQIVNVSLDGMEINNTLGSLSRLANAIWIVDALEDHKQGVLCLDLLILRCTASGSR